MPAGDLLRQLDQRLLPPLLRAVARSGQGPSRSRLLSWAALLSVGAVVLTAAWATDRPPVGDRTVGEVTRVGVGEGDSIPGYLRAAGDELAALPDPAPSTSGGSTWALVSLAEYLPPERLAPVLGDVGVSAVIGRVPLPGRQTQIVRIPALRVPEDVVAGMAELADRKDREAADYRARSAELTGGGPQERELRDLYDSGAQVASAEAAAYRAGCSCLYAAVVRAEPHRLRTVATRPGVRAVDPAPEVRRLDRTVFTPPLPEQSDEVRPPADQGDPTWPALPGGTGTPTATPTPTDTVTKTTAPAPSVAPSSAPATTTAPPAPPATTEAGVGPTPSEPIDEDTPAPPP